MKILVLGCGAGDSEPAWQGAVTRTRHSIAVSADGHDWVLLNASADLGPQWRLPQQHLRGVVLLDAQTEHVTGLLSLREGPPIRLYATPSVFEELTTGLPILPVLEHCCGVQWHLLPVAGDVQRATFHVDGIDDLQFEAVAIRADAPPPGAHHRGPAIGDAIALRVRDRRTGERLFYAPGLVDVGPEEFDWLHEADCVMADAAPAMIELLSQAPARRKVLVDLDDADPIRDHGSAERRAVEALGIEVAHDGMEIQL
jgi:pyrroloquinoline quinone biosynthesis protein B